ncbi:hypothetical protein CK203_012547 [Vitis vinifera]|uniref:Uncharacterized protein n=1 Tax=Vitis vinifera TaxID=29760 RepID=A0A438KN34_VITVI|nr:hypothetical protein CK203_012547 [Vitis vinifera]
MPKNISSPHHLLKGNETEEIFHLLLLWSSISIFCESFSFAQRSNHHFYACINAAADDNPSKKSGETRGKNVCSTKGEAAEPPETVKSKKEVKEPSSGDEEKIEGSPVLGLMTGQKIAKSETEETQGKENKEVPSESTIKKAIRKEHLTSKLSLSDLIKKSFFFFFFSRNITMAGVRRVLEEDLKLDKKTLDPYKKFISEQLDEVLKSPQVSKPTTGVKKGSPKKNSHSGASRKTSSEGSSESLESESDEEEVKPKTKMAPKGKTQNSEDLRKRKRPVKETKMPSKKRSKTAETVSEDNSDAEDSGNVSDDGHSQSSSEKPVKRKEVSAPAYGKRVENLKSIIKSCAMSVPPSVYKRVKQAPENKREAHLIKELEEILSKEGLSKNPSEKVSINAAYVCQLGSLGKMIKLGLADALMCYLSISFEQNAAQNREIRG